MSSEELFKSLIKKLCQPDVNPKTFKGVVGMYNFSKFQPNNKYMY